MSDVPEKVAEVRWTFEVVCGPGCPVAEIPKWGSSFAVTDLESGLLPEFVARLLGIQIVETFLFASGNAVRRPDGNGLEGVGVTVKIQKQDIPE